MGIKIEQEELMGQLVDSYSKIGHTGTLNCENGTIALVVDKYMSEEYRLTEGSKAVERLVENITLEGADKDVVMEILYRKLHETETFANGVKCQ